MFNPLRTASASIRAAVSKDEQVKVYARGHMATQGKGWSFDIAEPAVTGAETMLGVLAADVLGLFVRLAKQQRIIVDEVEATLSVQLADPLVHLGVIGAEGATHYEKFVLRAYLGTSVPEPQIRALWDTALLRAPLYQTLLRAGLATAEMQISS
jgi:hypothetical protein